MNMSTRDIVGSSSSKCISLEHNPFDLGHFLYAIDEGLSLHSNTCVLGKTVHMFTVCGYHRHVIVVDTLIGGD